MLDRDAHSYSEFKTFSSRCRLQHFYRYYMGLESTRFTDVQFFIIGRIVHQAIEDIYHGASKKVAVNSAAQDVLLDMKDDVVGFDRDAFDVKQRVARNMIDVFEEEVLEKEPFVIEDTEVYFEEEVAGIPFRGHIDRLYRLPIRRVQDEPDVRALFFEEHDSPVAAQDDLDDAVFRAEDQGRDFLRFIGEEKTRSSSTFPSGSKYEGIVKGDLQTHLYFHGLEKAGIPVDGIVHTSFRKAPSKYRKADNYDTIEEQKEAIDGYYSRARTPMRRVQMAWRPPTDELHSHLNRVKGDMETFYEDPFRSVDEFVKHDPERFPCAFCGYRRICHGNDQIDETFRRKSK